MFRKLIGDECGAITIMAALSLAAVVGVSALAVEFGHGLLVRSEAQRVADLAAYGGALVYNSSASTTDAQSAASNIAARNGVASGVSSNFGTSPTGDGNQALEVAVTTSVPLYLARVITSKTSLSVGATAYAEMISGSPGCIVALNSAGSGITMSGGTTITADDCAVASNNSVTLSGGAALTTKVVDYNTTAPSVGGGAAINPPTGTPSVRYSKSFTVDPLAGNSGVSAATGRLGTVSSLGSPSAPSVTVPTSTTTTSFSKTSVSGLPAACSDTYNSAVYSVTCSGIATFGTISVNKVTVTINTSSGNTYNLTQAWPITGVSLAGSGGTYGFAAGLSATGNMPAGIYNIVGSLSTSGTTSFGAGTYNVTGGIVTTGTTTFGAGTFNIGKATATCSKKGPAGESICNSSGATLTFNGPATFALQGGIYNGGGATLTLGSGSTSNSYEIGIDANSDSINVGTSTSTDLNDATGAGDLFATSGSIVSGGGTCFWIPAAAEHDINGYISLAGGTTLGAGVYTVTDYVAFGNNNGGDVTCNGTEVGVSGSNVSFVIGASVTPTGTCAGRAFCVAAGFGEVSLTAPSSGTTEHLLVIGPTSAGNTAGATFSQGSSGTVLSGAFYFPHGAISMSGSGNVSDGGGCLEMFGSQITLGGGSAAASSCTGLGGTSTSGTVALVQ